ncbi:MAG: prenyltransferase [Pseudomonadota bacterium]
MSAIHVDSGSDPRPGALATWRVATRPFSFPASIMPVVFASVAAITVGGASLRPGLFVLSVLAVVLLHAGANLLNDATDYAEGVDRLTNPASGAVVREWITVRQARLGATLCLGLGAGIGLVVAWVVGWALLWIGLAGLAIGVTYSVGGHSLKRLALGDLAVFLDFGVLGSLGAWVVQTGEPSWTPVLWSVPIAILVSAILHANNWRDRRGDCEHGVRTLAGLLSDRGAASYYALLLLVPFALVLALVGASAVGWLQPAMPASFLIVLAALPRALTLIQRSRDRAGTPPPLQFLALDAATAQLNLLFGVLCVAALGLDVLLQALLSR